MIIGRRRQGRRCFSRKREEKGGRLGGLLLQVVIFTTVLARPTHGQEASQAAISTGSVKQEVAAVASPDRSPRQNLATVTAVQVTSGRVELMLSAPTEFRRAALRGNAEANLPDRYYVDLFPALLNRQMQSVFQLADGPVRRVRLSQFHADTVRVVLDLRGSHSFQATALTEPHRLVIAAERAETAAQPQTNQPQFTTEAAAQAHTTSAQAGSAVASAVASTPDKPRRHLLYIQTEPTFVFEESRTELPLASPDFSVFLTPSSSFPWRTPALVASFSSDAVSTEDGSEELVCREAAGLADMYLPVATAVEQTAPTIVGGEDSGAADRSTETTEKFAQDTIRTGGAVMYGVWMVAIGAGIFLSFLAGVGVMLLWNLRKRGGQPEKSDAWETRMAYLEEAMNRAGMLNSSFFHSLEISQKRLEALLTQADVTEQNIRRLLHQAAFVGERPTGERLAGRTESYATAALLLSEGEEAPRVARTLKLPLAQVRVLEELRQRTQQEKSTGLVEKAATLQQNDVVVKALVDVLPRLNGTALNGTHLAEKGQ